MMKKRTFMQAILTAALLGAGSNALADDWTTGTYVYDGSGNIVTVGADQYVYDKVNRLHSATAKGPGNRQEYSYDSFGNRLKSTTVHALPCANDVPCDGLPLTVAPATNHVTSGSAAYDDDGSLAHYVESVYAADGHLVESDRAHDYVYDGAGMMSSQSDGGKKRQYIYTADDQRIAVYADQEWHWSVRDLDQRVVRDFTSKDSSPTGWTVNEDYIHSDQTLLSSVSTSGRRYVHVDHLGTPRLITGDQRQFLGEHAYFPFGTELALTSEDPQERLKLTGHERDTIPGEPLSLDYMHARYYGGLQGRFLSVDSTWESADEERPQSWNRYGYCDNNTVNRIDPDGLWPTGAPGREKAQAIAPKKLRAYVPSLTPDEAQRLSEDAIEEFGWRDFNKARQKFPEFVLPKKVTDLTKPQRAFVKEFLDRLPKRNKGAIDKVKNAIDPPSPKSTAQPKSQAQPQPQPQPQPKPQQKPEQKSGSDKTHTDVSL